MMITKIKKLFIEHPQTVNETYIQHLLVAWKNGFIILYTGCICIIHGILPFTFTTTASTIIIKLAERFSQRSHKEFID